MLNNFIILGLFLLAIISGMLGLGVAFVAVPFLSFFLPDLINQVQPLSLTLNGLTALFAMFGFAKSGYIAWNRIRIKQAAEINAFAVTPPSFCRFFRCIFRGKNN